MTNSYNPSPNKRSVSTAEAREKQRKIRKLIQEKELNKQRKHPKRYTDSGTGDLW